MKIAVLTGYYYPNMYPPAACIDKYIQELKKIIQFILYVRNRLINIKNVMILIYHFMLFLIGLMIYETMQIIVF